MAYAAATDSGARAREAAFPGLELHHGDSLDPLWTALAGALFGVSGVTAVYIGIMGLALEDPVRLFFFAPGVVLIAAAKLLDEERAWTLRLGAASGVIGVLVWLFVLLEVPPTNLVLVGSIALLGATCGACARRLHPRTTRPETLPTADQPPIPEGWIEE